MKALGIKSLTDKILDKSFNPKLIKKMSDEEAINFNFKTNWKMVK